MSGVELVIILFLVLYCTALVGWKVEKENERENVCSVREHDPE